MILNKCDNCNVAPQAKTVGPEGETITHNWCQNCLKKLWNNEGCLRKSDRWKPVKIDEKEF